MNKVVLTLLGAALIASVGVYMIQPTQDLEFGGPSPYITFVDEVKVDELQLSLQGKSNTEQLQLIKSLMLSERKFFNANQIMKILVVLEKYEWPEKNQIRNYAIQLLKPYIAPLSTAEATQILSLIETTNGLASGIIVSQVYDLLNNQSNQQTLTNQMPGYYNENRNFVISPQGTKQFRNQFLITSEGNHVGWIIDQTPSMNTVAYTQQDGTNFTRYQMLTQFYDNRFDTFQSFLAFSHIIAGNYTDFTCEACSTGSYEMAKALNSAVYNVRLFGGEFNLYAKMTQLFANTLDQLSDVYIWSDGIITEGTKDIKDFINLIEEQNRIRANKIRINTVSFLYGGNEPQHVKEEATKLMQTLADVTGGTFIQILPL